MEANRSLNLMGTRIDLKIEHQKAADLMEKVISKLNVYEKRFSANDPTSELMKINQAAGYQAVVVHPELFDLIETGYEESILENSLLNIAIGPLVQTWRIGFNDSKVPSQTTINECLELVNPFDIILNPEKNSVYLKKPGMKLDLGALAKGYIADLIADYLKKQKVTSGLINLGGNIVVIGTPINKKSWNIGVQNPHKSRSEHVGIVKLTNASCVTSGIYERYLEVNKRIYHHILDPKAGYPVKTDVASLTVVSQTSLDGEIWTTKLYKKSGQEIIETVNDIDDIECCVITKDNEILLSNNFKLKGKKL